MVSEDQKQHSQPNPKIPLENGENLGGILSPRFKSAAAMAGWDEEALLYASLIVEDTPDRDFKHKRRSDLNFKTPPTNSRRKRRVPRSPHIIPVAILDLDEEGTPSNVSGKKKKDGKLVGVGRNALTPETSASASASSSKSSALPCIDKLREELSCAICLEICFEPSTTPCGHSFCRKCLRSAADKCGKKCPKCRQLISNGRSCTVNTVLWNTIQLLFPKEVEARKAAGALMNSREAKQNLSPETAFYNNLRNPNTQTSREARSVTVSSRRRGITTRTQEEVQDNDAVLARRLQRGEAVQNRTRDRTPSSSARARSRRRGITSQDEDAALALRMQREEFMQAFRGSQGQGQSSRNVLSIARDNLRAMASRAMNLL